MQTSINQESNTNSGHHCQLMFDSPPDLLEELKKCASTLTEKLQNDTFEEASDLISKMMECRDQHIYQSIGKLTRGLHDSIVNFNVDSGKKEESDINDNECEFNDASNRLNYVIELTQNAADKTMDMVEEAAPLALDLAQEAASLKTEWARLKQREMTPDEFRELYKRMDTFFEQMDVSTEKLNQNLQNIILEQGFQDLTGQVLKMVIGLVTDVEENLVELVRIASQVESVVGIVPGEEAQANNESLDIAGEGPQVKAEKRDDVVTSQDDVDDLLSSLGF